MRALTCAKEITDAAHMSASQYISTRDAIRKARLEEKKAKEREDARKEKERKAEAKKAAAKQKKAEEKQRKLEQQQQRLQEQQDAAAVAANAADQDGDDQDDANEKSKARRRGKGSDELDPEKDHPILCERFSGHEIKVVDTLDSFLSEALLGLPVIWRAKRAPFKRVFDQSSYNQKNSYSAATALQAELKQFQDKFAQMAENDTSKIKHTDAAGQNVQEHLEALSMDVQFQSAMEKEIDNEETELDPSCVVVDHDALGPIIKSIADEMSKTDETTKHKAQQEVLLHENVQTIGFRKGQKFSGVMNGLYPHLLYQTDGTRVVAMASISHATRL